MLVLMQAGKVGVAAVRIGPPTSWPPSQAARGFITSKVGLGLLLAGLQIRPPASEGGLSLPAARRLPGPRQFKLPRPAGRSRAAQAASAKAARTVTRTLRHAAQLEGPAADVQRAVAGGYPVPLALRRIQSRWQATRIYD